MAWIPAIFVAVLAITTSSTAQEQRCWRNTPCTGPRKASFEGPWTKNIYAPKSRTVEPVRVLDAAGSVIGNWTPYTTKLSGNGSTIVLDFGKEVGGIVNLEYTASGNTQIGLAFTESKLWIGQWSDSSNGRFRGPDGAIYAKAIGSPMSKKWSMQDKHLRGGFRYLTLFLKDATKDATVVFQSIKLEIAFQPTWADLTAYQGYFHSSDEELNKIWYAGAYTLQTNCVPPNTGRQVPMLSGGWANNATMGPGDTIIVDGAKRDRAVWPGDMGIAVPSAFVSTGDLESIKNALQVMYDYQLPRGEFYEAGPPLLQKNSDTYHQWTMIGTYNYVLYTNDMVFLDRNWAKYKMAVEFLLRKVNSKNLLSVTGRRDWARWDQGGENSQANILMVHTLNTAIKLAEWKKDSNAQMEYIARTKTLKVAIDVLLWDQAARAYRDNTANTEMFPQDANSLAILFGTATGNRARDISKSLTKNWTPIGPEAPELPGNISPFISSFELQAHFIVGETARALDLTRRTWGWYLKHPMGTESTLIEGYRTNGSFGYRNERGYSNDTSYVSHAHGWSAGPTSALTNFVAGLDVIGPAGSQWKVAPQFGDLTFAEAGITTGLGRFSTKWEKTSQGYVVTINTPNATRGVVTLPRLGSSKTTILVNGQAVTPKELPTGFELNVEGGKRKIDVTSS
jgi:hypothetical protein